MLHAFAQPRESRYIDPGIEAIHFGQLGLMDRNEPRHAHCIVTLSRGRANASEHARRHFLLCDAYTPTGGDVDDGKLLLHFHSLPLRIVEVIDHPHHWILKAGLPDAIFLKRRGDTPPSGRS